MQDEGFFRWDRASARSTSPCPAETQGGGFPVPSLFVERQEFAALYELLRKPLFGYAAARLSAQSALDIVHDTFEVVWAKRDEAPSDPEQRTAWCFGIARNKIRQEIQRVQRKHHDNRFFDGMTGRSEPMVEDVAETVVESVTGRVVWESLSSDDRELLLVVASANLSGLEMASLLGISHDAYRRRVSRLRERIALGRALAEGLTTVEGGGAA